MFYCMFYFTCDRSLRPLCRPAAYCLLFDTSLFDDRRINLLLPPCQFSNGFETVEDDF